MPANQAASRRRVLAPAGAGGGDKTNQATRRRKDTSKSVAWLASLAMLGKFATLAVADPRDASSSSHSLETSVSKSRLASKRAAKRAGDSVGFIVASRWR